MNDQHKMELLKALREHGKTIQHLALGGTSTTLGGPSSAGGGTPSRTTGIFGGMNDLLGTQSNFQASGANIQGGTNTGQLNQAYGDAQTGLTSQQQFLNALQGQNGVQNQSDVYGQMQQMANGQGPNPAQAMLNQETGNNVANQAALMAGQRGAGANAGLMARQAAQQGAQTQQNAIGQGAGLQAQQSANAINNMAGIAQNQVNQQGQAIQGYNTAAQNEQNILQGANNAFNTAQVSNQANLNNVNAQISQGNQAAGNALTGGIMKGMSSGISSAISGGGIMGARGGEATPRGFRRYDEGGDVVGEADTGSGNYSPPSSSTAPSIGSTPATPDVTGGLEDAFEIKTGGGDSGGGGGGGGGGIMKMLPMLMAAMDNGGTVQPFDVQSPMVAAPAAPAAGNGPKSKVGQFLKGATSASPNIGGNTASDGAGNQALNDGASALLSALTTAPKGAGQVPAGAEDSPGSDVGAGIGGDIGGDVGSFDRGGGVGDRLKRGGKVPGKPKVSGAVDTLKNDTVPAMLSAGEVVLPRSVTQSKDPVRGAAQFMQALLRKKGKAA